MKTVSTDEFSLTDIEMLYHFMETTWLTMRCRERDEAAKEAIGMLSFGNNFLLSGVLATAAAHKVAELDDLVIISKYSVYTMKKRADALHGLRVQMEDLNAQNVVAVSFMCTFLVIWSMASRTLLNVLGTCVQPGHASEISFGSRQSAGDYFLDLITQHRMLAFVIARAGDILNRAPKQIEYSMPTADVLPRHFSPTEELAIARLQDHLKSNAQLDHLTEDPDPLSSLRSILSASQSRDLRHLVVLWPVGFTHTIKLSFERGDPAALVLVGYWVVCAHIADLWWTRNWAAALLGEIHDRVDPSWRYLLEWPLSVVHNA